MSSFEYQPLTSRVVFGSGTLDDVPREVRSLECTRVFVVSGLPVSTTARLMDVLGDLAVGLSTDVAMHTPTDVTERVLQHVSEAEPDCLVSLGGGSATGLSKALALRTGLPQIAVPTTYAGSEATPILGQTDAGRKTTLRCDRVLPRIIVYDVDLTMGLPVRPSSVSGLNAIAHAAEALYAEDANPVTSVLAEQAISMLARALPVIVLDPGNRDARSDALLGAWLCGSCLGTVGMALHHKLCHVLGGTYGLPHAETHAIVLPHVIAYNAAAAPRAVEAVARALRADDAAAGLFDLATTLGAPTSLESIGMTEAALDDVAEIAASARYWNPRRVDRGALREEILDDAYHGRRPSRQKKGDELSWEPHPST